MILVAGSKGETVRFPICTEFKNVAKLIVLLT